MRWRGSAGPRQSPLGQRWANPLKLDWFSSAWSFLSSKFLPGSMSATYLACQHVYNISGLAACLQHIWPGSMSATYLAWQQVCNISGLAAGLQLIWPGQGQSSLHNDTTTYCCYNGSFYNLNFTINTFLVVQLLVARTTFYNFLQLFTAPVLPPVGSRMVTKLDCKHKSERPYVWYFCHLN